MKYPITIFQNQNSQCLGTIKIELHHIFQVYINHLQLPEEERMLYIMVN